MKKTFLTAFAALLVAIPAVQAQKVNKSGLLTKIEKSDADIADAKKNAKASTWINRGKALYEAAVEPTKSLFVNMDAAMLKLAVGEPSATKQVTLLNVPYEAWEYPYFIAYIKDGKVVTWTQTDWVLKEAPAMAIEAYNKAYEIDPKSAAKVKDGLQQISDFCSQVGNTGIDTGEYVAAADAYATAFQAQSSPAYGAAADPALLYYAGYLRTVDGSAHPSSFGQGAEYLKKAIDLGYTDEEGNIYYYLFHCYYGLKNVSQDNVMLAKDALITGIGKFPKNERILDGLMQLYTAEEGVGDPADLVTLIDSAIADNPENVDLWFGRGRIFYALKNYDESIASFKKVVELKPDLFEGNYYLGVFYTIKADEMNKVMNEKQYSSQTAYDTDLKEVNAVYMDAVPWFEKAYELKKDDVNTLDFLKSICFRLRDEQAVTDALRYGNKALVEEFIDGQEIEVAVLGNESPCASVCGEIDAGAEFYDYEAKYLSSSASFYVPARIDEDVSEQVRETAVKVYRAMECRGLARVDFFVRRDDQEVVFNEINTIPGFTSISMYPRLFAASGIAYPELIDNLIALALEE